jgi:hypothetical protein
MMGFASLNPSYELLPADWGGDAMDMPGRISE